MVDWQVHIDIQLTMPVLWPNTEQGRLLAQAVNLYRAAFMGPYQLTEGYTREDFWDQLFTVYFDTFPEESKQILAREEVKMYFFSSHSWLIFV